MSLEGYIGQNSQIETGKRKKGEPIWKIFLMPVTAPIRIVKVVYRIPIEVKGVGICTR